MKKEEKVIITLTEFLNVFNNKHRREILKFCYNSPKTISELSRLLKSSKKVTWENVQRLKKIGFVKIDRRKKEKSRPVYVKSNVLPEWYKKTFDGAVMDISNHLKSIELIEKSEEIKKSTKGSNIKKAKAVKNFLDGNIEEISKR